MGVEVVTSRGGNLKERKTDQWNVSLRSREQLSKGGFEGVQWHSCS